MTLTLLAVAWLLTYLVHSTILLGGAWILSATGIVRSPVAKDTLWKVSLVGGLLTATIYSAVPYQPYSAHLLLPSATSSAPAVVEAAPQPVAGSVPVDRLMAGRRTSGASSTHQVSRITSNVSPIRSHASPITHYPSRFSWPQLLLGAWLSVAFVLLVRLGICKLRLTGRLGARHEVAGGPLAVMLDSLCAGAGVRRRIRLTVSTQVAGPVAIGWSEICLPERALTALAPAGQRAVLAHELGHLVRQDPLWLAMSVACENVFFVQPLNRLARRRIQEAAEYLCDDWAVRQTGGGLTLAKCLAEVATWIEATPRAVPVSGMAENRSQLVERVHRLLEGAQPSARRLRMAVPVAALALSTMAVAAPGISPPCDQGEAAPALHARVESRAPGSVVQSGVHTWATIRDGRLITFRDGFLPRLIGQGHLGIRRGGREIELGDGQRLFINGREAGDEARVSVCESDTLRIVDGNGRTLWRLEPVRLSPEEARDWGESGGWDQEDLASAQMDALHEEMDSLNGAVADLDTADVEELSRAAQELSERVTQQVSVQLAPRIAQIQKMSVRLGTDLAPRLAEMGARIAAEVAPVVAHAFGDGAWDSGVAPVKRHKTLLKHRP